MNDREIGVFIIWENARNHEDEILSLLSCHFKVLKKLEIEWDKDLFLTNLTSFYEMNMMTDCDNLRVRGNGQFLAVIVEDENPSYSYQWTNTGIERVNTNLFAMKKSIRDGLTHDYSFHASVTVDEARNNIVKLTGQNLEDFLQTHLLDGECVHLKRNCPGVGGWSSVEELFYVLNESMPYVVLRCFEHIPFQYSFIVDGDIDLLVTSLPRFRNLLMPGSEDDWDAYKFFNYINIAGEQILIHPKFVGDYYYDPTWEKSILETRVYDNGKWIPNDENLFWTLLYHGLFHKENYSKYEEYLIELAKRNGIKYCNDKKYLIQILTQYMDEKDYKVSLHLDGKAGNLVYENIDEHLLDEPSEYYLFKTYYRDQVIGFTVVSKRLIFYNSKLFTSVVEENNRWFNLDKYVLHNESSLYKELKVRETEKKEYYWRFMKRYDDISLTTYTHIGQVGNFDKAFISGAELVGDLVKYKPDKSLYIEKGIKVIDFYAMKYIREGYKGLVESVEEFLRFQFKWFEINDSELRPEVWDLCSKNCIYYEGSFKFYDFEAFYHSSVMKAYMIAVEVDLIERASLFQEAPRNLFIDLCDRLGVIPEKDYSEYIEEKYRLVDEIALGELNFKLKTKFMSMCVPIPDDLILQDTFRKQCEESYRYEIFVREKFAELNNRVAELNNGIENLAKSHSLVEDILEVEFSADGYDRYFEKNGVKKVLVYGLGQFGKRFLHSQRHKSIDIIGVVDRSVEACETYTIYKPDMHLPEADLLIVALLNGDEVAMKYKRRGLRCITMRELIDDVLKRED